MIALIGLTTEENNSRSNPGRSGVRRKFANIADQPIYFDDNVKSASGKKIPLNPDESNHECQNNPFNRAKRYRR